MRDKDETKGYTKDFQTDYLDDAEEVKKLFKGDGYDNDSEKRTRQVNTKQQKLLGKIKYFNDTYVINDTRLSKVLSVIGSIFAVAIFITALIVITKLGKPIFGYIKQANEIKKNISVDDFKLNSNIHIYDNNDNEILSVNQEKNIEYLSYDQIPEAVFNAFIAVEDKRFYKHHGIDIKSLARAGVAIIKNDGAITQGGSTITQQLVKLTYLSTEQSIERKVKEIIIALELEKQFSKKEILEYYVNNIYFGNNAYGINSASLEYFGKPVTELSLAQICYLAAIPNNPTIYDPYTKDETGVNPNTIERQTLFLDMMLDNGFITKEEYDTAKAEKIELNSSDSATGYDIRKHIVLEEVAEILMKEDGFKLKYKFDSDAERKVYEQEYNEAKKSALAKLYKNGYSIYTSFNEALQNETQEIIDNALSGNTETTDEGIYALQASTVLLNNETGLIEAIVGGRTSPITDYNNRATGLQRQNGSTMKPIAVYAPAIELKGLLPTTIVDDTKEEDGPKNAGSYMGKITARQALQYSSNVVAYKLYREVKPQVGLSYLQNMEFKNIVDADYNLSSGLGGLTVGTNVKEMAGAYSTLANKGKYNRPSCVREIRDKDGNVVYSHTKTNTEIYSEATAIIVTDMMKTVVDAGTGKSAKFNNTIEVAGKTGTTDDTKDLWFAGYTPLYTAVVWSGYDNPKTVQGVSAGKIWSQIMANAHKGLNNLKFDEGENIVKHVWVNSQGKEVPEGTAGAIYEIFPYDYEIEQDASALAESIKQEFIKKLENNMIDPNSNPNDKVIINTALANLDLFEKELNATTIDETYKTQILGLINYDREQLKARLKKIDEESNSQQDITISTDKNHSDKNNQSNSNTNNNHNNNSNNGSDTNANEDKNNTEQNGTDVPQE